MERHWYTLGWALAGAVLGVLALTWTWAFGAAAVLCFLIGIGVSRGVLSRQRLGQVLPFEVRWKQRPKRTATPTALGILDWEVGFEKYGKALRQALEDVSRGMNAVTEQMKIYGPRFEKARELSARQKMDLSREFAKRIRSHIGRMERAEVRVRAAIDGFADNWLKRIEAFPPGEDLGQMRPTVAVMRDTTAGTLGSIRGYRDQVAGLRKLNVQLDTNEALDKLLVTANRLVDDMEASLSMAESALTTIDMRASTTGVSRAEKRRRARASERGAGQRSP